MTHDKWIIFCHAYAAATRELAWSNEDQYLITVAWEHDLLPGGLRVFEKKLEATYEGLPQAFSEILMMDLEFATFGQNVTIEIHVLDL